MFLDVDFSRRRFLHPDDPNWPGLKPMDKRTSSATYSMPDVDRKRHRALDTDQETGLPVKPEGSPEQRHATPLVSQNDLFLRRKCENEEKKRDSGSQSRQTDTDHSRSRGRDSKRGREHDSRNTSTNSSKHYYDKTHSNFKRLNPGATSERSTKFYSDKRMVCFISLKIDSMTKSQVKIIIGTRSHHQK